MPKSKNKLKAHILLEIGLEVPICIYAYFILILHPFLPILYTR
jgi:hypothetical protein